MGLEVHEVNLGRMAGGMVSLRAVRCCRGVVGTAAASDCVGR